MPNEKSTKYTEVKAKIAALRLELKTAAKDAFTDLSKDVFEANPALLSFGWDQYTPYFNDGDECTFSANTSYPSVTIKASDGVEITYDTNQGDYVGKDDAELDNPDQYDAEIEAVSPAVQEFLNSFEDDDLKTMFGDHQTITVKRDGTVDTDDYDHE